MAPDVESVVTPVTAPAAVTLRPEEAMATVAPELPMVVAALPLVLMPVVPVRVRPPVPCRRPAPELTPTAVSAPALVTLKLVEVMRLPKVPVSSIPLVAAPVELICNASAAPAWLMMAAVAAVPLVPFTVNPTTLFTVGAMVSCAVVAGFCTKQVGQVPAPPVCHVGKVPAPLDTSIWPTLPVPTFWKAPVEVVPPARIPYGVVDETPVPPY